MFVWSGIAEVPDLVYVLVGTLEGFLKTLTFGLLAHPYVCIPSHHPPSPTRW